MPATAAAHSSLVSYSHSHCMLSAPLFVTVHAQHSSYDPDALPSAGSSISGAVAAARAVPCGFIGAIARVVGVTVSAPHIGAAADAHIVIAAPEIGYAANTSNAQSVRVAVCGSQPLAPMDGASFNWCRRERRQAEASGRGDDESELS